MYTWALSCICINWNYIKSLFLWLRLSCLISHLQQTQFMHGQPPRLSACLKTHSAAVTCHGSELSLPAHPSTADPMCFTPEEGQAKFHWISPNLTWRQSTRSLKQPHWVSQTCRHKCHYPFQHRPPVTKFILQKFCFRNTLRRDTKLLTKSKSEGWREKKH